MKSKEIYVALDIAAPIEEVWEYTQNPSLHEQWDIRFSSITYQPKQVDEPQLFTYTRTIGCGLKVSGWGKSVGNYESKSGIKSSSLHFGTSQKLSPIKEGKGYWQYKPAEEKSTTTFLTAYHYDTNYGWLGRILDRFIFHPLMGWGTALSFDILKRWLEKKEAPRSQYLRFFMTYGLTLLFSFIWLYHGLVPKVIAMHPEELRMTGHIFPFDGKYLQSFLIGIGIIEALFGVIWLLYRKKQHLFKLQCLVFPLLMLSAIMVDPGNALHPFSPVTFNIVLIVLSVIGLAVSKDLPSAKTCSRKRDAHV